MKKLISTIGFLLVILGCQSQTLQTDLSHMNPAFWQEDIDFLNKIIQKEFESYQSGVKESFQQKITDLKNNLTQLDNEQVTIRLMQIVAGLQDGHTEVQIFQKSTGLKRLPLIFYFFEEGLFILGGHEPYRQYIGNEVTHIGKRPIKEVLRLLKTVITHDNQYEILHAGTSYLLLPVVMKFLGLSDSYDYVNLTLSNSQDQSIDIKIDALPIDDYNEGPWYRYWEEHKIERPLSSRLTEKDHWYEYLEADKTMYFYYGTVNNQKGYPTIRKQVKSLFAEIDRLKPEKLVIDIRKNRGGNYFRSRPLIEAIKDRPWLNKEGKVFAISGRTTFSAAMVTSIFLKKETNTILVGEPSRGHPNKTDNVEHVNLPNSNLRIEYTTRIKKHWPELGDSDIVPIDVLIPVKFSDYARGTDPALEYILKRTY